MRRTVLRKSRAFLGQVDGLEARNLVSDTWRSILPGISAAAVVISARVETRGYMKGSSRLSATRTVSTTPSSATSSPKNGKRPKPTVARHGNLSASGPLAHPQEHRPLLPRITKFGHPDKVIALPRTNGPAAAQPNTGGASAGLGSHIAKPTPNTTRTHHLPSPDAQPPALASPGGGTVRTLDYPPNGPPPPTYSYGLSGISVNPQGTIYVNDNVSFAAQEQGNVQGGVFNWTITDTDDGTVATQTTNSPNLSYVFTTAAAYTIAVQSQAGAPNGQQFQGNASTQVGVTPLRLTAISATPASVAQFGIVHYDSTIAPNRAGGMTWEYKNQAAPATVPWTQFSNQRSFDNVEGDIGTWNVRGTLVSGGVTTQQTTVVTIRPRPTDVGNGAYTTHWAADVQTQKWADLTLTVTRPAAGERTAKPTADIRLDLARVAGANNGEFGQISGFKFTFASRMNGGAWTNGGLDQALNQTAPEPNPVFSIGQMVNVGGNGTMDFAFYAEMPPNFNWGFNQKTQTLLKVKGTLTWATDAQGVYTQIATNGITFSQAKGLAGANPTIPTREVPHP